MKGHLKMRHSVALLLVVIAPLLVHAQAPSLPPEQRDVSMQNVMESYARHHRGKVALYAKDVRTGKTVAIDPDVPVNTASVIKVAVMLEAMYQLKEGRASFDDVIQVRKEDQVSGSGVLQLFRPPAQVNLETA